jgi:hypothetical protein
MPKTINMCQLKREKEAKNLNEAIKLAQSTLARPILRLEDQFP